MNVHTHRIYVPFAYQCKVESGIEWYRSSGIDRLYKELKRSEIGLQNRMHDVFIYSHRHYTQRTGAAATAHIRSRSLRPGRC